MAGTALACAWISLPWPAFLAVGAAIASIWIWHLPPALQCGRRAVRALEVSDKGGARWQDAHAEWHEVQIQPGSYVSNWLVVLNLGESGQRGRSIVLLPDCAAADDLRRLRVWLRWRLGRQ